MAGLGKSLRKLEYQGRQGEGGHTLFGPSPIGDPLGIGDPIGRAVFGNYEDDLKAEAAKQTLDNAGDALNDPSVTTAPGDPANASAQADRDAAAEDERRRARSGGRASTILTSPLGVSGGTSARKVLLGA